MKKKSYNKPCPPKKIAYRLADGTLLTGFGLDHVLSWLSGVGVPPDVAKKAIEAEYGMEVQVKHVAADRLQLKLDAMGIKILQGGKDKDTKAE